MYAGIPYHTFPDFDLGPLTIRSFGLIVGIGVMVGAWVAARDLERWGMPREETYRLATRLVVGGVIGSRITWVLSHLDQIDSPIDLIAIWEGGIQFSGGFVAAIILGIPTFRKWSPILRWRAVDGYLYGLTLGLAIGRIGCYSVGEHFGRTTESIFGTTYRGGETQEGVIGTQPLVEGMTFHHTALYEFVHLVVLMVILTVMRRRAHAAGRSLQAGTIAGIFCIWYGMGRFLTDTVRINDERVLGMTGAQWMAVSLLPAGLWILLRIRPRLVGETVPEHEVAAIQARVLARSGASSTDPEVVESVSERIGEPADGEAVEPTDAGDTPT